MLVQDVCKIAVLRANAIGDYVFTLPALDALRAAYPWAEIVLLGQPWHAAFLAGRPGPVDRVVVVPRLPGVREDRIDQTRVDPEEEVEAFFSTMEAECFDLALQMHGGGRNSNPFVQRLKARVTAGLASPDAPRLDRTVPYVYFQSEILRMLEVVAQVGATTADIEPHLAATAEDLTAAAAALPPDDRPLAVLHPGVGDGRRRWPAEKFAAVGDALTAAGAQVAINGIAEERGVVDEVLGRMRTPAVDLCGRLSLAALVGVLSRARVVVSNDSGPLHVAGALGVPTAGIYWCGNLINAGPPFRTRHRPHLSWQLDCPVCGRNCIYDNCEHHESFVSRVPVDEVVASALELLAATG